MRQYPAAGFFESLMRLVFVQRVAGGWQGCPSRLTGARDEPYVAMMKECVGHGVAHIKNKEIIQETSPASLPACSRDIYVPFYNGCGT